MMIGRDHPDIESAERTGFASGISDINHDTPNNRWEFITDYLDVLANYLRKEEPDVLNRFIEAKEREYLEWLN